MHAFILESIVEQAEEHGYRPIETTADRIWFSLDGKDRIPEREILLQIADDDVPIDFIANSMDRRYIGAIARGWKYGSTLLMELTEKGMIYQAMTADELQALEDRIWRVPTTEEFADMDAFVTEVLTGTTSEASERIKDRYVQGANEELEQRRRLSLLTKIEPNAPCN